MTKVVVEKKVDRTLDNDNKKKYKNNKEQWVSFMICFESEEAIVFRYIQQ